METDKAPNKLARLNTVAVETLIYVKKPHQIFPHNIQEA